MQCSCKLRERVNSKQDECPCAMQSLEGKAEARTWLLPLLRAHVRQAHLAFWGSYFLPMARAFGNMVPKQSNGLAKLQCSALEAQLWACLPGFATYPLDCADAFR